MRLIFLGDVVGKAGREAVYDALPRLRTRYQPDLVVVNGENASHGFGISGDIYMKLREAGAEVVGVATIVDRGAGPRIRETGLPYRTAFTLTDLGLA